MQATRLTLICHARTVAQKLARFPTDEPLELDWQAARGSRSGCFKTTPRVLCGPELRTRQTAALFGSETEIAAALRDYDVGRWKGLHIDQVHGGEPEALLAWLNDPDLAPHGGESVTQLGERVAAWLKTLEATPGHIVAVTHPWVVRAALAHVLQSAAFNVVDVEPLAAIELRFTDCWRLRIPGTGPEETV